MHPDGYIEIVDRAKDVIISGGENISTIEVEKASAPIPRCWSARSSRFPTRTGARYPRRSSRSTRGRGDAEEMIAFCRERLAHFKCPDAIEFGPLPKTSTGKIQKFVLRDREWSGQDKRISGAWAQAPAGKPLRALFCIPYALATRS